MPYNHNDMVSTLISYDKRESKKKYYNPYALAIYLRALQSAETDMAAGTPIRQAIVGHFSGRLLDRLLKTAKLDISTRDEQRCGI
jgi:hypothetical protein